MVAADLLSARRKTSTELGSVELTACALFTSKLQARVVLETPGCTLLQHLLASVKLEGGSN